MSARPVANRSDESAASNAGISGLEPVVGTLWRRRSRATLFRTRAATATRAGDRAVLTVMAEGQVPSTEYNASVSAHAGWLRCPTIGAWWGCALASPGAPLVI